MELQPAPHYALPPNCRIIPMERLQAYAAHQISNIFNLSVCVWRRDCRLHHSLKKPLSPLPCLTGVLTK